MDFNRRDCRIKWNPITAQGSNVHFKDYLLQIYSSAYSSVMAEPGTGYTFQTYSANPHFDFTFDLNKEVFFGAVQAKFFVQVKGRSIYDVLSNDWAFATAVNHTPPATPINFQMQAAVRAVQFSWGYCTAADFANWKIRKHEGTGAFGEWEDTAQNSIMMGLSADSEAGKSISLEVKAVDIYRQESASVTGNEVTMGLKTADSGAFQIVPSNSKGSTFDDLKVLYDGDLAGAYVSCGSGGWVQYEYPVEFVINGASLWINSNFNLYLGYYDENEAGWKYLAGSVGHSLSGGTLVSYTTQTGAKTNYFTTAKEVDGKVVMPFPLQRQFEKIRLNKVGGSAVNIYEWKNNVFVLADEIVAGRLFLGQGVVIASSATGDRGAVFNEKGLGFWKNNTRTMWLSASGNARFGVEGVSGIVIDATGNVQIDGSLVVAGSLAATAVKTNFLKALMIDAGDGHIRISPTGIYVGTGVNTPSAYAGDIYTLMDATDNKFKFMKVSAGLTAQERGYLALDTTGALGLDGWSSSVKEYYGKQLLCKVIEIGDWNMDSVQTKDVTHGLTASKIRSIDVIIIDDFYNYYAFPFFNTTGGTEIEIRAYWNSTIVRIYVVSGSNYNSNVFDGDGGSFNRGWVTLWYIP